MSKSITEQSEIRRMLDSWTLELANWLMSEKDMERRAFRSVAAERLAEISLSSNCLDHTADCDESISNQSTMTNIDETMNKIDSLLADRGLTSEYKEQAVRQLLYHLYIALDIYRYMTYSEKNKAGYWFRMFRSSFSLIGFLKERKRKRDKEKSPLHPSYKERETELKEKAQKMCLLKGRESGGLEVRQKAFWNELLQYEENYGREMLLKFYAKWAEETADKTKMLWETKKSWSTKLRLLAWSKRKYQKDDEAAEFNFQQVKSRKGRQPTVDVARQQAILQEREQKQHQQEQEREEWKRNAVSYKEYLEMKGKKEKSKNGE